MDRTEKLAAEYLAHRGYTNVEFEPDGNIPPDFLIESRIAVEVRRLNQNYGSVDSAHGLEEDSAPLLHRVSKLAKSFGPPRQGESWYVFLTFRRPIEEWNILKPKLRVILDDFMNSSSPTRTSFPVTDRFKVEMFRSGIPRSTFYVMAGDSDRDSGGFVVSEIARNLEICIKQKTKKIAAVKPKYPEWWLVLLDYIDLGLRGPDLAQFRAEVHFKHDWDKIIMVDPTDTTYGVEV